MIATNDGETYAGIVDVSKREHTVIWSLTRTALTSISSLVESALAVETYCLVSSI
jgi:hypothetical protein